MQIDDELSGTEAAALLNMSPRHLNRLAREGWFEKNAAGKYVAMDIVHDYARFRDDREKQMTRLAGDNRVRDARARDIEIRTAEREKVLIRTGACFEIIDEVVGMLRSELDGLPARLTRDQKERRKPEDEIEGVLPRTAERIEKQGSRFGNADITALKSV